jgi:hypothetical protein
MTGSQGSGLLIKNAKMRKCNFFTDLGAFSYQGWIWVPHRQAFVGTDSGNYRTRLRTVSQQPQHPRKRFARNIFWVEHFFKKLQWKCRPKETEKSLSFRRAHADSSKSGQHIKKRVSLHQPLVWQEKNRKKVFPRNWRFRHHYCKMVEFLIVISVTFRFFVTCVLNSLLCRVVCRVFFIAVWWTEF